MTLVVALYRRGLPPRVIPLASMRSATFRLAGTMTLKKAPQPQNAGMREVQAYLEGIWGEAAVRFRLLAENLAESTDPGLER
jgi:hypothetical protein